MTIGGWGGGEWGQTPWGGGDESFLQLLSAEPIRENVVRLFFSAAPLFTGLLNANDASNPARYDIGPIEGTTDGDGVPTRDVDVVLAERALVAQSFGRAIDVTVDRPFSPFPARYFVAVNQLVTSTGTLLGGGGTGVGFYGLYRFIAPPNPAKTVPSRDIANPQSTFAALATSQSSDPRVLGTIPIDDTGDYAFDEGIVNLKKRIYRRLVTTKGRFAHLPGYGVGILTHIKRLNLAAVRAQVVADAESQISQEPDVAEARVSIVNDPTVPNLLRVRVRVRATIGNVQGIQAFEFPFLIP